MLFRSSVMICAAFLVAPPLVLLSGCVAPEEPVVRRPARSATPTSVPANLEPAPTADRKLKAPEGQQILNVNGLSKPKSGPLPPL